MTNYLRPETAPEDPGIYTTQPRGIDAVSTSHFDSPPPFDNHDVSQKLISASTCNFFSSDLCDSFGMVRRSSNLLAMCSSSCDHSTHRARMLSSQMLVSDILNLHLYFNYIHKSYQNLELRILTSYFCFTNCLFHSLIHSFTIRLSALCRRRKKKTSKKLSRVSSSKSKKGSLHKCATDDAIPLLMSTEDEEEDEFLSRLQEDILQMEGVEWVADESRPQEEEVILSRSKNSLNNLAEFQTTSSSQSASSSRESTTSSQSASSSDNNSSTKTYETAPMTPSVCLVKQVESSESQEDFLAPVRLSSKLRISRSRSRNLSPNRRRTPDKTETKSSADSVLEDEMRALNEMSKSLENQATTPQTETPQTSTLAYHLSHGVSDELRKMDAMERELQRMDAMAQQLKRISVTDNEIRIPVPAAPVAPVVSPLAAREITSPASAIVSPVTSALSGGTSTTVTGSSQGFSVQSTSEQSTRNMNISPPQVTDTSNKNMQLLENEQTEGAYRIKGRIPDQLPLQTEVLDMSRCKSRIPDSRPLPEEELNYDLARKCSITGRMYYANFASIPAEYLEKYKRANAGPRPPGYFPQSWLRDEDGVVSDITDPTEYHPQSQEMYAWKQLNPDCVVLEPLSEDEGSVSIERELEIAGIIEKEREVQRSIPAPPPQPSSTLPSLPLSHPIPTPLSTTSSVPAKNMVPEPIQTSNDPRPLQDIEMSRVTGRISDQKSIQDNSPDMSRIQSRIPEPRPLEESCADMSRVKGRIPDQKPIQDNSPDMFRIQGKIPEPKPFEESGADMSRIIGRIPDHQPIRDNSPDMSRIHGRIPEPRPLEEIGADMSRIKGRIPDQKPIQDNSPDMSRIQGRIPEPRPLEVSGDDMSRIKGRIPDPRAVPDEQLNYNIEAKTSISGRMHYHNYSSTPDEYLEKYNRAVGSTPPKQQFVSATEEEEDWTAISLNSRAAYPDNEVTPRNLEAYNARAQPEHTWEVSPRDNGQDGRVSRDILQDATDQPEEAPQDRVLTARTYLIEDPVFASEYLRNVANADEELNQITNDLEIIREYEEMLADLDCPQVSDQDFLDKYDLSRTEMVDTGKRYRLSSDLDELRKIEETLMKLEVSARERTSRSKEAVRVGRSSQAIRDGQVDDSGFMETTVSADNLNLTSSFRDGIIQTSSRKSVYDNGVQDVDEITEKVSSIGIKDSQPYQTESVGQNTTGPYQAGSVRETNPVPHHARSVRKSHTAHYKSQSFRESYSTLYPDESNKETDSSNGNNANSSITSGTNNSNASLDQLSSLQNDNLSMVTTTSETSSSQESDKLMTTNNEYTPKSNMDTQASRTSKHNMDSQASRTSKHNMDTQASIISQHNMDTQASSITQQNIETQVSGKSQHDMETQVLGTSEYNIETQVSTTWSEKGVQWSSQESLLDYKHSRNSLYDTARRNTSGYLDIRALRHFMSDRDRDLEKKVEKEIDMNRPHKKKSFRNIRNKLSSVFRSYCEPEQKPPPKRKHVNLVTGDLESSDGTTTDLESAGGANSEVAFSKVANSHVTFSKVASLEVASSEVTSLEVAYSKVSSLEVASSEVASSEVASSEVTSSESVLAGSDFRESECGECGGTAVVARVDQDLNPQILIKLVESAVVLRGTAEDEEKGKDEDRNAEVAQTSKTGLSPSKSKLSSKKSGISPQKSRASGVQSKRSGNLALIPDNSPERSGMSPKKSGLSPQKSQKLVSKSKKVTLEDQPVPRNDSDEWKFSVLREPLLKCADQKGKSSIRRSRRRSSKSTGALVSAIKAEEAARVDVRRKSEGGQVEKCPRGHSEGSLTCKKSTFKLCPCCGSTKTLSPVGSQWEELSEGEGQYHWQVEHPRNK